MTAVNYSSFVFLFLFFYQMITAAGLLAFLQGSFFFFFSTLHKVGLFCFNITAPFNNMRTLKFKAQPTNAFFATVNQMFADSSKLSTAAKRAVIKSLCRVQTTNRVRQ